MVNNFTKRLTEYLEEEYFFWSEEDIFARAKLANSEYQKQIFWGEPPYIALEFSNEVLYSGLLFSPIGYLKNILETDFNFNENTSLDFAKKLYKKQSVLYLFEKYEVNDFFIGSEKEHLLVADLLEEVKK